MPDEKVIRASKNGPYLIPGSMLLVDEDGNPTENSRKMVALCRCGGSKHKPYCDGTHKTNGFTADEVILRLR
jgi:CDGSH-type Zn-finger protein